MHAPRALTPAPLGHPPASRAPGGAFRALPPDARTSLHGRTFPDPVASVAVSCVALPTALHPHRGFRSIPNPVHNLGANASLLGSGLWTTVGSLWINLAQARVVHVGPELSQGSPQAPSPGLDTSRRGRMRVIHTIHRTYYYDCFSLQRSITKKKQGCACARTRASRSRSQKGRGRLERRSRTLYGDEQRLVFLRGGLRKLATPRVWKGLS
jgi:hypothetical protein